MLQAFVNSILFTSTLVLLLQLHLYPGMALRMTALQVPEHVVLNQTVRMECNFNLDRELLYSVKWYKDGHEFYRYVPKDVPAVQIFQLPGVSLNELESNHKSISLTHVNLSSSGRYRCEVSAEAPAFQTVSDHADMIVVVLPEKGPQISGHKRSRYQIGDVVRLNCTSAPSKPAASLAWFINDEPADKQYLRGPRIRVMEKTGLEISILGLEFPVKNRHFKRGDMKLKCLATIATVYLQSNEESVEDARTLKAPALESRETRAQSHTRNEMPSGASRDRWGSALTLIFCILVSKNLLR